MLIIDDPQLGSADETSATREWALQRVAEWRREHPDVPILVVIARPHPDDIRLPEDA